MTYYPITMWKRYIRYGMFVQELKIPKAKS